jgi:hypothetical protein
MCSLFSRAEENHHWPLLFIWHHSAERFLDFDLIDISSEIPIDLEVITRKHPALHKERQVSQLNFFTNNYYNEDIKQKLCRSDTEVQTDGSLVSCASQHQREH